MIISNSLIQSYPIAEIFKNSAAYQASSIEHHLYEKKDGQYCIKKPLSSSEVIEMAKNILSENINHEAAIESSDSMKDYLTMQLSNQERELFCVLYLNAKRQPIAFEVLFSGTISGAEIHPREIMKRIIAHNASAVVLAHNHPSSNVKPSFEDIRATQRIKNALAYIDVALVDHFVISQGASFSFAENGEL